MYTVGKFQGLACNFTELGRKYVTSIPYIFSLKVSGSYKRRMTQLIMNQALL